MKTLRRRFLPLARIGSSLALVTSGHLQALETVYTWDGDTNALWATTGNWGATGVAPSGGTFDARLRVFSTTNNPLTYSSAQGNTTFANTTGNAAGTSFRGLVIGSNTAIGTMLITGGNFSTAGSLTADVIGARANGTLTISGGSYTGTSVGTILGEDSSAGTSTLTVGGTGSATVAVLQMSGATSIVNLNTGGTLTANQLVDVDNAGTAGLSNTTFNFNGGTLKAGSGAATAFMTGLTSANVLSGGAKIDTNGKNITIGQALLNGGGGLTLNDTADTKGTLTLTSTNHTYAGATTVTAGKLVIDGNISTSTTTVQNTGTLGGSGFAGAVSVESGGMLAPGNSIGQFDTRTLTLGSASIFQVEIDSASAYDQLGIDGNLNITGGAKLDLVDFGSPDLISLYSRLTIMDYSGAWNSGLFTLGTEELSDSETFAWQGSTWRINYDDTLGVGETSLSSGGTAVTLTVVPEPSSLLLGCLGLLGVFRRRR
jgi:hypothetical protein